MSSWIQEQMRKEYEQEHQNDHYFNKVTKCKKCNMILTSKENYCSNCGTKTN